MSRWPRLPGTEGLNFAAFERDKRTQQAVVLNLLLIGEAASRISEGAPGFVAAHPEIPWAPMRGMRNRIAHGYLLVDSSIIRQTVNHDIPGIVVRIRHYLDAHGTG